MDRAYSHRANAKFHVIANSRRSTLRVPIADGDTLTESAIAADYYI